MGDVLGVGVDAHAEVAQSPAPRPVARGEARRGVQGEGAPVPPGTVDESLEDDGRAYDAQQSRAASQGLTIAPEPVNTYLAEIEEFSNAILEDRESLLTGALGLRSQKVLAACYASARSGQAIEVV